MMSKRITRHLLLQGIESQEKEIRINQITAAYKELYNHDNGAAFKRYVKYAKNYKEPAQKEEPIQERLTRLITPLVKNALKGDSHGQKELHN